MIKRLKGAKRDELAEVRLVDVKWKKSIERFKTE